MVARQISGRHCCYVKRILIKGFLNNNDTAIITKGDLDGVNGVTNAMKIVRVGQVF